MKCWCFNEEQLATAVREYVFASNPTATAQQNEDETRLQLVYLTAFLTSEEARKHKLGLHGMWDRQDPAPTAGDATQKKET